MKLAFAYFQSVKSELSRVVWPKRREVIRMTFVVIIISVATAFYVGALDLGFTKALEVIVSR